MTHGLGRALFEVTGRFAGLWLALVLVCALILLWRMRTMPAAVAVTATVRDAALGASVLFIIIVTLLANRLFDGEGGIRLIPFEDVVRGLAGDGHLRQAIAQVVANVILFVPFGAALRWRLPGLSVTAVGVAAFVFSMTVEVLQAVAVSGRTTNTTDVITNTAGGLLGAALVGRMLSHTAAGTSEPEPPRPRPTV